ncbi:MAG: metallophosphoesterase family protein [Lachnospiraceae bacterium]|nr:metallophosphoesterase family protein [Lachnospiraceae bacterium]
MKANKLLAASLAMGLVVSTMFTPVLSASAAGSKSYGGEVDVSTSTFKADTDNSAAFQTWRDGVWSTEKADSGKIALTPGKTEKDLNFAWYSEKSGTPAVRIWKKNQEKKASIVKGTATEIAKENWQGSVYTASNKVSVKNYLKANTTYVYQYTDNYTGKNTVWSETETYKTGSFSSFSVILTGDPQIGASGSSDDYTASDSSAARDTYNWNLTMESAMEKAPNAAFLLSAGDQIDKSGATKEDDLKTRESEYAGYLYPEVFRSLPIASTIGNHDSAGVDYTLHFNNPNSGDGLGSTAAGNDYYFSYGDVLFISLNSNNRNQAEHRELMTKAVNSHKDAAWKIVIFHSDIYGSGEPHADTDAASNRIIFAPLMDEFDIDVCLTGHDHTYSRSYQILNGNVVDYDLSRGSVKNPEGTLYITTGSGSGSKYYNLLNYTPYYIAERTNVCLPAYSTMKFSKNSFTICTYDYEGNQYADAFTITKSMCGNVSAVSLLEKAESINEKLYTESSVKAVKKAAAELKNLCVLEDPFAEMASVAFGTDADPFTGYGSVKSDYRYVASEGKTVNRLGEGYSTLIDKTIYMQLNGDEVSVVSAKTYENAKQNLIRALCGLKKVKKTGHGKH